MKVKVYTISNGGLPRASYDTPGSLRVMLKAALVLGCGDKASSDWSLIYDSINNNSDPVGRIVLQSKSPASEMMYYEIVDDSQERKLKMHEGWDEYNNIATGKSVSVNVYAKLSEVYSVVANSSFVLFVFGGKLYFFGDYDPYSIGIKSVIYGAKNRDARSLSLPSDNNYFNVGSNAIIDINNRSLVLKNHHVGHEGWTNKIAAGTPNLYVGMASSVVLIKPVEIGISNNQQFEFLGTMPIFVYSTSLDADNKIMLDGRYVYMESLTYVGEIFFMVDEL